MRIWYIIKGICVLFLLMINFLSLSFCGKQNRIIDDAIDSLIKDKFYIYSDKISVNTLSTQDELVFNITDNLKIGEYYIYSDFHPYKSPYIPPNIIYTFNYKVILVRNEKKILEKDFTSIFGDEERDRANNTLLFTVPKDLFWGKHDDLKIIIRDMHYDNDIILQEMQYVRFKLRCPGGVMG